MEGIGWRNEGNWRERDGENHGKNEERSMSERGEREERKK